MTARGGFGPGARRRLILASASPRRLALLVEAGFAPEVRAVDVDETATPGEAPAALARRLAERKLDAALAGSASPGDGAPSPPVWLAADTVVAVDGDTLGKPTSAEDAAGMLRRLSGRGHTVVTAVAIGSGADAPDVFDVRTTVHFRPLPDDEVHAYAATGEGLDKAGAYGIQGRAAGFVRAVEGSYTNVVGLPVAETVDRLVALGLGRRWTPEASPR